MSKKLGLESKYKQFIKPTKLKEFKSAMDKANVKSAITNSSFLKRSVGLFPAVTKGILKKTLPGRVISNAIEPISKLRNSTFFKRAMTLRAGNKKMGGGMMMKYNKGNDVKLSPKQKKIAAMAGNPKKIEAVDFDKLRTMKANKGIAVDFDKTTYNVKDVYKLANKNKTGDRTTSKDVREAARILKVKLPPKAR
jgi:hypothetical protein